MQDFFSRHTHNKTKKVIKKLCKDQVRVNLVFIPYKIGSMFQSIIVYKFVCASSNACYVGETVRHLPTRIKEQLKTDKRSHIYQHLSSNQNCFNCCTENCFSILDQTSTKNQLKIKEALYIKWLDPIFNKQKKTLKIMLCLQVGI